MAKEAEHKLSRLAHSWGTVHITVASPYHRCEHEECSWRHGKCAASRLARARSGKVTLTRQCSGLGGSCLQVESLHLAICLCLTASLQHFANCAKITLSLTCVQLTLTAVQCYIQIAVQQVSRPFSIFDIMLGHVRTSVQWQ